MFSHLCVGSYFHTLYRKQIVNVISSLRIQRVAQFTLPVEFSLLSLVSKRQFVKSTDAGFGCSRPPYSHS